MQYHFCWGKIQRPHNFPLNHRHFSSLNHCLDFFGCFFTIFFLHSNTKLQHRNLKCGLCHQNKIAHLIATNRFENWWIPIRIPVQPIVNPLNKHNNYLIHMDNSVICTFDSINRFYRVLTVWIHHNVIEQLPNLICFSFNFQSNDFAFRLYSFFDSTLSDLK